jgi:CxxC-x17-CxxC domain-containing protein
MATQAVPVSCPLVSRVRSRSGFLRFFFAPQRFATNACQLCNIVIQAFPARRAGSVVAAEIAAARAFEIDRSAKTGKQTGKLFGPMADFKAFPFFGKPAMEYANRVLKCVDCGAEFIFTAGEQLFFHDKQFKNDPKHCKECKAKRVRGGARVNPETQTRCAVCGEETTVPFKPTQGRPVLCRSCFQQHKPTAKAAPAAGQRTEPHSEPQLVDGD